jgi:hypothetical protein
MKTLREFIQEKEVTAFDTIDTLIISAVVKETRYGLDVDTSSIIAGTLVTTIDEFIMDGSELTVNGITINTEEVTMLGYLEHDI